jgi:UDP-3-O-[3-hydroxymyristoyl] glucosamine N-acyltransferase
LADPRFFNKPNSLSLESIAQISGAVLGDGVDPNFLVNDLAALHQAGPDHLSFFDNVKYKDDFLKTKAGACFVHPDYVPHAPSGVRLLVSKSPYKAYAKIAQNFYPEPKADGIISLQAHIDQTAKIGAGCTIDAGAVIKAGAEIGQNCIIESGGVIGQNVKIGDFCRIGTNASVSHALIGSHVRLYPGVCVGQDGFGFAIDPTGHVKVPQLGRVIIEDHVEIGANSCIDRGAGPDTVIGQGTWIDNLVQIGHNVRIGKGCVIVAQAGVAGSTVLDDFVALGGQVGIAGHLHIGRGARIAAQSGVMKDIPAGEEHMGYPAMPLRQFMRQIATLNRLIKTQKNHKS